MTEAAAETSVEIDAAARKIKLTGPNALLIGLAILSMLTLLSTAITAYAMWRHQEDTASASANFVTAIKEQTGVMREGATLQREQNCIMRVNRVSPEVLARDPEMCKNLSR